MAFVDLAAGGWCADADGSGGFTNWRTAATPMECVDAAGGSGTWWMTHLSQAQNLQTYVVGLESSGGSTSSPFTTSEIAALKYQAANPSPWSLSTSDGVTVSGAILVVWSIAWGFRALARSIHIASDTSD
jgi:hypothetical protein